MSIRLRLIIIVLIAVLPALGVSFYVAGKQQADATEQLRLNVRRLAELVSREERQIIAGVERTMKASAVGLARFVDRDQCGPFLRGLMQKDERISNAGVAGIDGSVACQAIESGAYDAFSDALWFTKAVQRQEFSIGEVSQSPASQKPVLVFGHPIMDGLGDMTGVVFFELDLAWLNSFEANVLFDLPEEFELIKIDKDGSVVASQPKVYELGQPLPYSPIEQAVSHSPLGHLTVEGRDGEEWFYAFLPVDSIRDGDAITLILGAPVQALYAEANADLQRNILLVAAGGALVLAVAWLLGDLFIMRIINDILDASRGLAQGNLDARMQSTGRGREFNRLATAFNDMAQTIQDRESEKDEALASLSEQKRQLSALHRHLERTREHERITAAREIHDELGQSLTGLGLGLHWVRSRIPEENQAVRDKVDSLSRLVEQTTASVQRICSQLRPVILEELGLGAGLEWLGKDLEQSTDMKVSVHVEDPGLNSEGELALALYRITQETLTNIVRHSQATEASITLKIVESRVVLTIRDNGIGIQQKTAFGHDSFGLAGIRERVESLGGDFFIDGVDGQGTVLEVSAPIAMDTQENSNAVVDS